MSEWRNGALGKKFDAYPQRQSVTESSYNNSLADHHTWSTIKTLPATLPELRTMDRGPPTGVTGAVSQSALDFIEGVGLRMAGLASLIDGLLDWLVEGMRYNFIPHVQV